MADRILFKVNQNLTDGGNPPAGYNYVGYDGFTFSECDENGNVNPIGMGGFGGPGIGTASFFPMWSGTQANAFINPQSSNSLATSELRQFTGAVNTFGIRQISTQIKFLIDTTSQNLTTGLSVVSYSEKNTNNISCQLGSPLGISSNDVINQKNSIIDISGGNDLISKKNQNTYNIQNYNISGATNSYGVYNTVMGFKNNYGVYNSVGYDSAQIDNIGSNITPNSWSNYASYNYVTGTAGNSYGVYVKFTPRQYFGASSSIKYYHSNFYGLYVDMSSVNSSFIGNSNNYAIFTQKGKVVLNNQNSNFGDFQVKTLNESNAFYINSATNNIGIGTDTPHNSAQLQVVGGSGVNRKGFLPPVMTGAEAEQYISNPAEGLLIYATNASGSQANLITSKGWWGYDGTTWVKLG
jgi:hypothetical protein